MSRFCSNCGISLADGAHFCPSCGHPQQTVAPSADNSAAASPIQPMRSAESAAVQPSVQANPAAKSPTSPQKSTTMAEDFAAIRQQPIIHSFFTTEGRLNRLAYLKKGLVMAVLITIFSALFFAVISGGAAMIALGVVGVFMISWLLTFVLPDYQRLVSRYGIYLSGFWGAIVIISRFLNNNNKAAVTDTLGFFFLICMAVCILANVFITVRRCHDLNKTGWLVLVGLVPYIDAVFSICMLFMPGTKGKNEYGDDPLERPDTWDK